MWSDTYQDASSKRIVEPFDKLDCCTLAASRSADQSDVSSRFDHQVEVAEDSDTGACRIPEVNIFEPDVTTSDLGIHLKTIGRFGINFRNLVEQSDDVVGSSLCCGDVGHEPEDVSSLDTAEDDRLNKNSFSQSGGPVMSKMRTIKQTKNELVEYSMLATRRDP